MKVTEFNYDLPEELIAQTPLEKRDESRLMILNRQEKTIEHNTFKNIIEYLKPGDVLTYYADDVDKEYGHTVWIIGKTSDHYIIADCNYGNTCQIRWDVNLYFSQIGSVKSASIAPWKINDGDTEAPKLSNIHIHSQSIGSDSIRVRVYASDNVGVKSVKFSTWQSGNSATSGTTKWASSMGNGYWETTFTKKEANIVGDNLGCIRAWAYDEAGNESAYDGIYDFVFG